MKFLYQYKTSDGVRHDAVVSASSKDAVYLKLKALGIKPFGVVLAPGFFNRFQDVFQRHFLLIILVLTILALGIVGYRLSKSPTEADVQFLRAGVRRQPMGDAAIIAAGIHDGWKTAFAGQGERFLASFAIPGVTPAVKNVAADELIKCKDRRVLPMPEDSVEVRQIKAIVEGMKNELREYLDNGGDIARYGTLLVQRQEQEIGYFKRVQTEVDTAIKRGASSEEVMRMWEDGNSRLRRMGIRPVDFPENLE